MIDDTSKPPTTPDPATTDAGDRKVVPLIRPRPNTPPVPAGQDDDDPDPGPRAA
jgi:hypothetical protein